MNMEYVSMRLSLDDLNELAISYDDNTSGHEIIKQVREKFGLPVKDKQTKKSLALAKLGLNKDSSPAELWQKIQELEIDEE